MKKNEELKTDFIAACRRPVYLDPGKHKYPEDVKLAWITILGLFFMLLVMVSVYQTTKTEVLRQDLEALRSEVKILQSTAKSENTSTGGAQTITLAPIKVTMPKFAFDLPEAASGEFKTYMDYRKISDTKSAQYKLQKRARTNELGLRVVDDQYLVALGTYYADRIGQRFIVTLSSGVSIPVMVGDFKANEHTDAKHMYVPENGNIIEFIVDPKALPEAAKISGDISYLGYWGSVTEIMEVTE